MSYFECPYCKKKTASVISLGNSIFMFNSNKQCNHCFGRIKLKIESLFLFYAVVTALLILGFVLILNFFGDYAGYASYIFLGAIIVGQFYIPDILYKAFGVKIFSPKDDVELYIKKIPASVRDFDTERFSISDKTFILILLIFAVLIFLTILFSK